MFDIKGTTTTDITIGFQTGLYGKEERPQTSNGVVFGPGGYAVTSQWQSYKIPVSELVGGKSVDMEDVTSPLFFQGTQDDNGYIHIRNARFSKSGEDTGTGGGHTSTGELAPEAM